MKLFLTGIIFLIASNVFAAIEVHTFDSVKEEQRYKKLINELRCLVCQNQNLADSNADLAVDLRNQTYTMIKRGASDDEIIDFMVSRYGDFVLYRPPFKLTTALLWIGPFIILGIGVVFLLRFVNSQRVTTMPEVSDEELQHVRNLLDEKEKDNEA
jgi:cytochrome c-type biogenesis protein CcmH